MMKGNLHMKVCFWRLSKMTLYTRSLMVYLKAGRSVTGRLAVWWGDTNAGGSREASAFRCFLHFAATFRECSVMRLRECIGA